MDLAPYTFTHRQDRLFFGVQCPDWIKWSGITENVISLLLHERQEERRGPLNKHWNTELFNTYIKKNISLTAAVITYGRKLKQVNVNFWFPVGHEQRSPWCKSWFA